MEAYLHLYLNFGYLVPTIFLGSVTVFDADVARPSRSEMATRLVERLTSSYTRIGTIVNHHQEKHLTHTPCVFYVQFVVNFILLFFCTFTSEVWKKEQNKFDNKLNIKDARCTLHLVQYTRQTTLHKGVEVNLSTLNICKESWMQIYFCSLSSDH